MAEQAGADDIRSSPASNSSILKTRGLLSRQQIGE
jgi:hypothetical protein